MILKNMKNKCRKLQMHSIQINMLNNKQILKASKFLILKIKNLIKKMNMLMLTISYR